MCQELLCCSPFAFCTVCSPICILSLVLGLRGCTIGNAWEVVRGAWRRGPGSSTGSTLCRRFFDLTEPSWLKARTVRVQLLLPEARPELGFWEGDADVCCRDCLRVLQSSFEASRSLIGLFWVSCLLKHRAKKLWDLCPLNQIHFSEKSPLLRRGCSVDTLSSYHWEDSFLQVSMALDFQED